MKWEVNWFNNNDRLMIRYDSNIILRCIFSSRLRRKKLEKGG